MAVIALPFLDRSIERRPWKRPAAMGSYAFVLFALLGLGLRSPYLDAHDPAWRNNWLSKKRKKEIS